MSGPDTKQSPIIQPSEGKPIDPDVIVPDGDAALEEDEAKSDFEGLDNDLVNVGKFTEPGNAEAAEGRR